MCLYKHSIQLFKLYNSTQQSTEWLHLNLQQNFNSRVNKFLISNYGQFKIGKNIMTNRLTCINNKVELNWLNLSLVAFKLKCKALFYLSNEIWLLIKSKIQNQCVPTKLITTISIMLIY